MKTFLGWSWFAIVQLIMLVATFVGLFLLIPFCLAKAWDYKNDGSISDKRRIDNWSSRLIDCVYGNPEDGVSGQYALIWVNGVLSPYMPNAWLPWRAYCWSALRNSCDNLKYVFAWKNGPQAMWRGRKLGWWPENGFKVPVL